MFDNEQCLFLFLPAFILGAGVISALLELGEGGLSTIGLYFISWIVMSILTYIYLKGKQRVSTEKVNTILKAIGYTCCYPVFIVLVYHLIPLAFK